MSSISKCPKCEQQVTIPDGVAAEAEVRCPLCEAEYSLSEALAQAPPALIPVGAGAVGGFVAEPSAVPEAKVEAEVQPDVGEEYEEEYAGVDVGEEVGAAAQADAGQVDGVHSLIDTGQTPVDASALADFGGGEPSGTAVAAPTTAAPPRRKARRRKPKSMGRELMGVFFGGIAGLAIGYYLLNIIVGKRFDYLKVYLPGVKHTSNNWPFSSKEEQSLPQPPAPVAPEVPSPPKDRGPDVDAPPAEFPQVDVPEIEPPPDVVPEPEAPPAPAPAPGGVGPRSPPSYNSAELGAALKAVHESGKGDPTAEIGPQLFDKFCRMAETLTFVRGSADDRRLAIRRKLESLGEAPGMVDRIERLSADLLSAGVGSNSGILLAGTVTGVAVKKGLYGAAVRQAGGGQLIPVMSRRPLLIKKGDRVLILGAVVNDPAKNLHGYNGKHPLIIWSGMEVAVQ